MIRRACICTVTYTYKSVDYTAQEVKNNVVCGSPKQFLHGVEFLDILEQSEHIFCSSKYNF